MKEQFSTIKKEYRSLKKQLESPKGLQASRPSAETHKRFHHLEKTHSLILQHEDLEKQIQDSQSLAEGEDPELIPLAKEELKSLSRKLQKIKGELKALLLPEDPDDGRNVILEIRAGAGGDESALFAQNLFSAYSSYAESRSWKTAVVSVSEGNVGGFKEIVAHISGQGVYKEMKYESGVHRVQRVPKTESQGRVHTSTVTVVVLPEADPVQLKIDPADIRVDVCRSSGAGGQHVNTTDSAVRLVHLPTKITVYCQQEKSQHANKERAFKTLYARLRDRQKEEQLKKESQQRRDQMGGGDRSQRIRTYNFPQSRMTDHRLPITKNLTGIMEGGFKELFLALREHFKASLK